MATYEAVSGDEKKQVLWVEIQSNMFMHICHTCLPGCIFILISILCGNMDYLVFAEAVKWILKMKYLLEPNG